MEEHFAGSCINACDNPALSNELKEVCDVGSQQFCKVGNNIYNPQCRSYLGRAISHVGALNSNETPTRKIMLPNISGKTESESIRIYASDLVAAIAAAMDPKNIGSAELDAVVKTVKEAYPNANLNEVQRLVDSAVYTCSTDNSAEACADDTNTKNNNSWLGKELRERVNRSLTSIINKTTANNFMKNILDPSVKQNWYRMFVQYPRITAPIVDKYVSFIEEADLDEKTNLIQTLRNMGYYLKESIDTKIVSFLAPNSKVTGTYKPVTNINLFTSIKFTTYVDGIISENAKVGIKNDPFIAYVEEQKTAITDACLSNPLSETCKLVNNVINTADRQRMTQATVEFCSLDQNVKSQECIDDINNSLAKTKAGTPNTTEYDVDDINRKILNYCVSTAGKLDTKCRPRPPITGSEEWLKNATLNTTDSKGVTTSKCGTAGNLTIAQCENVCATYPDLCEADLNKKCSNPNQRYNSKIDHFEENNLQMYDQWGYWTILSIAIFIVIFGFVGTKFALRFSKDANTIENTLDSNKPISFQMNQS